MKRCVLVLAVGAMVQASLAVTDVLWDQSAHPTSLADGAIQVEYDGHYHVKDMALDPAAAGGLRVGGDDLTFSSDAVTVTSKSVGTTTFANGLFQTGTTDAPAQLSFASDGAAVETIVIPLPSSSWTTCIENMDISHITNVTAHFDKTAGKTTGGVPCDTVAYVSWSADHTVLRYEFQKYTSTATIRAVVVGFQQSGADIQVQHMYYAHLVDSKNVIGDDKIGKMSIVYDENGNLRTGTTWGGYSYSKPSSNVNSDCFASNVVVALDVPASRSTIELSGSGDLKNVAVKVGENSPATVVVKTKEAFPVAGAAASSVEVGQYGVLTLNAADSTTVSGFDHGIPITVRKGGLLRLARVTQLSMENSTVILDGGALQVGAGGMTSEPGHYIHNLTLRDGAQVKGESMRVRSENAVWKVEGDSPSSFTTGISAWSTAGKNECFFTFDVADVTGNDQADFIVAGPWTRPMHLADSYRKSAIVKKGQGTMRIDGTFALGYRPLTIEAGVLVVNGSLMQTNAVSTAKEDAGNVDIHQDIALAGGALEFAAGSTNHVGVLMASAAGSALALGADAEVCFSDSSAQNWAADATVVVTFNPETSRIRFGTDANGLTAAQLKQLRYQSATGPRYRFGLDADGYLTLTPPAGFVIMVK